MNTNLECINEMLDYMDAHLFDEALTLDSIAKEMGYSKYHLHRMFSAIVGLPVHTYIQRRRLTEGARLLIFSDQSIIDIALYCGYETQRSFSSAFKSLFKRSPHSFRKHHIFLPLQLKYHIGEQREVKNDMNLDIQILEQPEILLVGYTGNTSKGFSVIGKCWGQLHAKKQLIPNKTDLNYLIGLNDYSDFSENDSIKCFDYYACAQVNEISEIPKGMISKILPPSKYVFFRYKGYCQDSMEPISQYIYQEWFPQSTCQFNENNPYDFVKYGEYVDDKGRSPIEYWVPIQ